MNIISGMYKRRKIKGYDIIGTRPTASLVRESLFAMINSNIKDSVVLDLYAGSGALAIEALSNYAKYAYLVDINKNAINVINENINNLNIKNATVIKGDAKNILNKFINDNTLFDIIFLDPPYNTNEIIEVLDIINKNTNILNNNSIIVCETNKNIDYSIYNNFTIYKKRNYSDKIITILIYSKDN